MHTVAIIEDNSANMKLLRGILQREGFKVLSATTADEGIKLATEHIPDIILMDIHLPGIDGLQATQILKSNQKTSAIPIIAVTAKAMDGDREHILASGCNDYVAKPIRYKKLLATIKSWLAGGKNV